MFFTVGCRKRPMIVNCGSRPTEQGPGARAWPGAGVGGADEGSFTPPPQSQPPTVNIHTFIFAHRDSNPRPPAVRHESQVCYPTVPLGHPVTLDASFPEKLLKIVATIGEIFSLKFTKYCLAELVWLILWLILYMCDCICVFNLRVFCIGYLCCRSELL